MSSARPRRVLNSCLDQEVTINMDVDELEKITEEEETDRDSDITEHYVLEYNKDKVLSVIKKDNDTSKIKNEKKRENNVYKEEKEKECNEDDDDDSKSVQEVLEHICGKCYKSFSSFQHFRAHSMYCKSDGEIAKNIMIMLENLGTIEQESIELEKQNICFCCKENLETAHSGHIRCPRCPKSFKSSPCFERHLCLIHSDQKKYQCNICNAQCPSSLILELHKKAHQRGKPFACKKCGEEFTRKYHLSRHMMFSGCESNKVKKKTVVCKVCGKEFYRLDNLRIHLKQHLGQDNKTKDYQCPYCEKAFYGTATLNIHIRTHTGERPFTCDLCGNSFPSNPALRKHRRTHTGERPYQCSQCLRSFAAKEVLNRHVKTHTGEKPHGCDLCGKRFIQATQLKQHLIQHQKNEKSKKLNVLNKCRKCKLVFNSRKLLSKHLKEEHDVSKVERNVSCPHCKKFFQTDGGMKRHITRIHIRKDEVCKNPEKRFVCNVCDDVFEDKKSLQFHKLKVHNTEERKVKILEADKQGDYRCRFCNQKFSNNASFVKHMENDHGAVFLPVDNQKFEQSSTSNDSYQLQVLLKEETECENIEIVDLKYENASDEGNVIAMDIDQEEQQREQEAETFEICDDNNDNDYVLVRLKKTKNKKSPSPTLTMDENALKENIIKLLDLLIEKEILSKFGYPNAPIEEILLKVIKNCGHNPKRCDEPNDNMTKLREYVKLLFTVVVDNDSIKELLNNHPVDKVIYQVLDMADQND